MFQYLIYILYRFATSFVYYAVSLNTSDLGGSDHVNFMISGAIEIPAYIYNILILNKFGRRWPISTAFLITGLCYLCLMPISKGKPLKVNITKILKF